MADPAAEVEVEDNNIRDGDDGNESDNEAPTALETVDGEGGDADPSGGGGGGGGGGGKKKKKKKKKKGKKGPKLICVGGPIPTAFGQSHPPKKAVNTLFEKGSFPVGQFMPYETEQVSRVTDEEARYLERLEAEAAGMLDEVRNAAEVHRQVRHYAQRTIKPGMLLSEVATLIEDTARVLIAEDGLDAGLAFPCGVSINECAAHYTPNPGDMDVLGASDVMKVDFGVHIGGRIIDCAFTWCQDPKFEPLIQAVKDATNEGIRAAGVDVRLCDIGAAIQEVMESNEIELDGQVHQVLCCQNLNGHSIEPYRIHAGKSVPIVAGGSTARMEEGEFFAIETFGSTGRGFVEEAPNCSHFMREFDLPDDLAIRSKPAKDLLDFINESFGSLAFCRRWLTRGGQEKHFSGLKTLVDMGIVQDYPPLVDIRGSYTAQFEHTIFIKPNGKEVLSRGDDY